MLLAPCIKIYAPIISMLVFGIGVYILLISNFKECSIRVIYTAGHVDTENVRSLKCQYNSGIDGENYSTVSLLQTDISLHSLQYTLSNITHTARHARMHNKPRLIMLT